MWLYVAIAVPIHRDVVVIVITGVCMFGAPWREPTAIAANLIRIWKLLRGFNGMHNHISREGNASCGKSRAAVASPYRLAFVIAWVVACASSYVVVAAMPPLYFA